MLYTIMVEGLVQGVGYRYFVRTAAEKTNVKGIVKNLMSGDVYIEAEGSEGDMEEFLAMIKRGPRAAFVRELKIDKTNELKNYKKFEVTF